VFEIDKLDHQRLVERLSFSYLTTNLTRHGTFPNSSPIPWNTTRDSKNTQYSECPTPRSGT